MEINRMNRRVWRAARVDGEYKNICVEYEFDVELNCPRIWKVTDDDTGMDVLITMINEEDREDIFKMINEVK
jgi:hypothetical protein